MKTPDPVSHHKPTRNRILAACMAATLAIGTSVLNAQMTLLFSGGGGAPTSGSAIDSPANKTQAGSFSIDLSTLSTSIERTVGPGTTLSAPSASGGGLAGLGGTLKINFIALGTSTENFNPTNFTGGTTYLTQGITAITTGTNTWAVGSNINENVNNFPGQGIVFSLDLSGVTGDASGLNLTAVRLYNQGNGCRINHLANGASESTPVYSGGLPTGTTDTTYTVSQALADGDKLAFWSSGGSQRRLYGFTFENVPAGITPPIGLTASTNGAQVNLDWADDLSGTLDFYTVYRSATTGGPYDVIAPSVATSNYIDTTVATGTTYYYVVTATDDVGPTETGNSNQAQILVRIQPPTGLTRTQGNGVIDLDWADNTSGILDFYSVYRSETPGGPYTQIALNVPTSDYSDITVTNGTTYYYVVTATDNVVPLESANSAQVSGTPFVPVPGSSLYARLDGSEAASVTTGAGEIVSLWSDLTANGLDASSAGGAGEVYYPSLSTSASGLVGVDFGYTPDTSRSTLKWFDPAGQDSWLDFSDGAGALPYTGFAVFAAVHADSILGGINRDVVMANTESKFSLRYEAGRPKVILGGQTLQTTAGAVAADETVVLAVNYNATTGELKFWDSQSGVTVTGNVPAADFSDDLDLFLGGSVNSAQYMQGLIGEAKIYRGVMDAAAFQTERNALTFKWAGLTAPAGLVATEGDGEVILDWGDQIADSYTVYRDSVEIATGLVSSDYTDNTVTNGITYQYYVTATKDSNVSADSATVSATPYAPVVGSSLYVHLDATNSGSVTVVNTNEVTGWADISGGAVINATADVGILLYPSASQSPTSLSGLDTGDVTNNTLLAFDIAQQDAWLDFTSPLNAKPYSGFAVFTVFKADGLLAESNRDVVLANNGNPTATTGSFVMKYQGGVPQAILGGQTASLGNAVVDVGDTVVLAANYNAATGELEVWDSENGSSATITVAAADFSSVQDMYLGGSLNPSQSMAGMIGEVKVYRGAMTPAEFAAEQTALTTKWIGVAPAGFSTWITGTFANGPVPGGLQGPNQDADNDGISNLVEYAIAGQDPTVNNSTISTFTAGTLSFTKAAGTSGLTYAIQESTDLGVTDDWTEVTGASYVNDAGTISYTLTPGTPVKNFLRLQVLSN